MKTPRIVRSAALRGRRGIILFVSGALAIGIGVAGVRALGTDSLSPRRHVEAEGPGTTQVPVAPQAVTNPNPLVAPTRSSPPAEPAPDPNALEDGVYPTFVRAVDVRGTTVTIDVLQAFVGQEQQREAATEDGVSWQDVMYDPVYIRNENPLLRTLPVTRDADITFLGGCEAPSRQAGLRQLQREAVGNETYYFNMSVIDGSVVAIEQRVASSGC